MPDSLTDLESRRVTVQLQIAQLGDMRLAPSREQVAVVEIRIVTAIVPVIPATVLTFD